MRAARLLSILLLLQTRGRMTAQQLAEELEVSVRTIYRDVESLHSAGVPLYGDAGWSGGYQLLAGYRTQLTGLTADEAESMFLTGLPGPAAELGLGAVVTAAQLKLLAALPAELRDRAGRIRERFHLDAPGWYRNPDEVPHLMAVAEAVWGQHRIRIRYRRWEAPREVIRTLDPYGVVLKGGRWYLVAASDRTPRTYRVSEILELHPLGEGFTRPEGFVLQDYWQSYLDEFEARRIQGKVVIRLSPKGLRRLHDLMGQAVARQATENAGPPDSDGWVTTTIPIEGTEHARGELLRLGAEAVVEEPEELRQMIKDAIRELGVRYQL
ncbi:transcriptional regulator [Rhizocola hellebori]|uniref:Transcriptional regulator n=1 Tax=Rhizocola hellebori TaxID=1392758 RepID=A0A8J3Q8G3_9ACTN|nr:WYL domain-containing protein [Rhizocola hellebori]GIH05015.1 transcriptional regulator [Rhizocola hellebori]